MLLKTKEVKQKCKSESKHVTSLREILELLWITSPPSQSTPPRPHKDKSSNTCWQDRTIDRQTACNMRRKLWRGSFHVLGSMFGWWFFFFSDAIAPESPRLLWITPAHTPVMNPNKLPSSESGWVSLVLHLCSIWRRVCLLSYLQKESYNTHYSFISTGPEAKNIIR